ncbi:MAG: hypothetical protein N3H31_00710 [Candidatus Nezhaarchaeota archaeon]|nr:hypothetical protein [Candidatus Nezhaarchaeota archaeon]
MDTSLRLLGVPDVGYPTSINLKARVVKYHEDFNAVINLLGICYFPALSLMLRRPEHALYMEHYAKVLSAVTSMRMTPEGVAGAVRE